MARLLIFSLKVFDCFRLSFIRDGNKKGNVPHWAGNMSTKITSQDPFNKGEEITF